MSSITQEATDDAKRLSLDQIPARLGFSPVKTYKGVCELWYTSPFCHEKDFNEFVTGRSMEKKAVRGGREAAKLPNEQILGELCLIALRGYKRRHEGEHLGVDK